MIDKIRTPLSDSNAFFSFFFFSFWSLCYNVTQLAEFVGFSMKGKNEWEGNFVGGVMSGKISSGLDDVFCCFFLFSPRTAVSIICLWYGFRVSPRPKVMKERREMRFSQQIL